MQHHLYYDRRLRLVHFGGGLGAGELYTPDVLFDSLTHRSPCFPDVDFTAFTGNPVNHTILFSWIDSVPRSHQICCSRQR